MSADADADDGGAATDNYMILMTIPMIIKRLATMPKMVLILKLTLTTAQKLQCLPMINLIMVSILLTMSTRAK